MGYCFQFNFDAKKGIFFRLKKKYHYIKMFFTIYINYREECIVSEYSLFRKQKKDYLHSHIVMKIVCSLWKEQA
ncbi:hypothetical protein AVL50_11775 [Flammeovirga sp. SJP92]|nr:hypothetical protein AVL50_11775 [Flammeovirga sp. SJP92]